MAGIFRPPVKTDQSVTLVYVGDEAVTPPTGFEDDPKLWYPAESVTLKGKPSVQVTARLLNHRELAQCFAGGAVREIDATDLAVLALEGEDVPEGELENQLAGMEFILRKALGSWILTTSMRPPEAENPTSASGSKS